MKKLILMLILFIMVSTTQAQWFNPKSGVSTTTEYFWTSPQHYVTLFADQFYANNIDSTKSTYWYKGSTLWGFVDPSRDSVYFPRAFIGNLGSNTIINGGNVTSNSVTAGIINSDTVYPHSPLMLFGDSIFFGRTNDSAKIWYNQITRSNSVRGAIYPNVDYGMNIGTYNKRIDTVNARVYRIDENYYTNPQGSHGINVYGNYIRPEFAISNGGNDINFQYAPYVKPTDDSTTNLGKSTNRWRTTYTRTLNADSVISTYLKGSGSIIMLGSNEIFVTPSIGQSFFRFNQTALYSSGNGTIDIGTSSAKFKDGYFTGGLYSATATFSTLPTYTDDTAAGTGGLTTGMLYKTATGEVRIKL